MDGDTGPDAVAYLRISSDPRDEQLGVRRQRKTASALADQYGAVLREVFEDNDVSSTKARGADTRWPACLEYVRDHRPAYLFGLAMDRLGRRLADLEGLEELCAASGTTVITVKEGDVFQNPAWPILAGVAKMEARNTAQRVRWAQVDRRARGLDTGGRRAYGYAADRVTAIPDEWAVIREAGSRAIEGESPSAIARDLNARGISTVSGAKWSHKTLYRMLTLPRYVGRLTHHGEDIGRGAWQPVWSPEEWAVLQAAVNRNRQPRSGPPAKTLLGGLIRCGNDDFPMVGGQTQTGPKRTVILSYRCKQCGRSRRRDVVDGHVVREALARGGDDLIPAEVNAAEAALDAYQHRDVELELEITMLYQRKDDGKVGSEDFYRLLDGFRREQRAVQAKAVKAATDYTDAVAAFHASDRWDTMLDDARRSFLRSRIVVVRLGKPPLGRNANREIRPGEIEIEWRNA